MPIFSATVSAVALVLSLFTLWFSVLRRGKVCSTHPAFIAVRYDFVGKQFPQAKIFLRSMLYSTGKRGRVIESLFLRVSEGQRSAEFSFWGYGDAARSSLSGDTVTRISCGVAVCSSLRKGS
jgi:hypothetical protein